MGFTSLDDLVNQITVNGKYLRREMVKSTAPVHTAGGWHSLVGLNGNPNADYNDTGSLSVQDLFYFLAGYFGGCT
jgi:hypothetical protein